jgi:hypothetical protein
LCVCSVDTCQSDLTGSVASLPSIFSQQPAPCGTLCFFFTCSCSRSWEPCCRSKVGPLHQPSFTSDSNNNETCIFEIFGLFQNAIRGLKADPGCCIVNSQTGSLQPDCDISISCLRLLICKHERTRYVFICSTLCAPG